MPALLILNYDVTDAAALAAYRELAGPVLAEAGVRVVTTADTHDLGEAAAAGRSTVVWRFPSVESAQAVYASAAYQELLRDRLAATTPRFSVIVEAVDQ